MESDTASPVERRLGDCGEILEGLSSGKYNKLILWNSEGQKEDP